MSFNFFFKLKKIIASLRILFWLTTISKGALIDNMCLLSGETSLLSFSPLVPD